MEGKIIEKGSKKKKKKKKVSDTIVTRGIKTAETTKRKWVDGARLSGQETVITESLWRGRHNKDRNL